MANLKEIAPMILAGLAGAASPRGADAFANINRMKMAQEEGDRREAREQRQAKRLEEADRRAAEADERAKESHSQIVSMRDIRMREDEEARAQREQDAQELNNLRQEYFKANPAILEDPVKALSLNMADTKNQFDEMISKYGELSTDEIVAKTKRLAEQGIDAQVGKGGIQSARVRSQSRGKEGPSREEVMFDVQDQLSLGQDDLMEADEDIDEAMEDHRVAQLTLRDVASSGDTAAQKKALADARRTASKVRRAQQRKTGIATRLHTSIARIAGARVADEAVGGLIVQPSEQIPQEALPGENAPFEGQSDPEVDALADEMGITLKDVAKGGVSAETNRANKARMR